MSNPFPNDVYGIRGLAFAVAAALVIAGLVFAFWWAFGAPWGG